MTRGRIVVITNDTIYGSIEFNGDMHPWRRGGDVLDALETIKAVNGYKKYVLRFNERNYEYPEEELFDGYTAPVRDVIGLNGEAGVNKVLDFSSDYLYIKNIGSKQVIIKCRDEKYLTIDPNGIAVLDFGKFTDACKNYSHGAVLYDDLPEVQPKKSRIEEALPEGSHTTDELTSSIDRTIEALLSDIEHNKDILKDLGDGCENLDEVLIKGSRKDSERASIKDFSISMRREDKDSLFDDIVDALEGLLNKRIKEAEGTVETLKRIEGNCTESNKESIPEPTVAKIPDISYLTSTAEVCYDFTDASNIFTIEHPSVMRGTVKIENGSDCYLDNGDGYIIKNPESYSKGSFYNPETGMFEPKLITGREEVAGTIEYGNETQIVLNDGIIGPTTLTYVFTNVFTDAES